MKAIMVMFDSLNRHFLPPYGNDWVKAPNFQRLAQRTVTFTNSYVGSMPCMPARRELHTGRYNFLHRSWGPLEPFDDSMPELLKNNGIYTHLVSDHYHYWETGGATYHTKYDTWEFSRGQEGDPWKGEVQDPQIPKFLPYGKGGRAWRQDWINRKYMTKEEKQPQAKTFALGLEFIEKNREADNWFLQLETFDPHEPFFTQQKYQDLYPHHYNGPHFDWPTYQKVTEREEEVAHCRYQYAALVSMCDEYLGKVLDVMDEYDLWKDTMLIVNTDHGFLLSEHEWWGKCAMPFYNEIAQTPLFIWDPRAGLRGERCHTLVQTIDLAPTLLDFFQVPIPKTMQGKALGNTIATGQKVREAALFGIFGGHVNCTDGRYVYMLAPQESRNEPLFNYTLMPTHMREMFSCQELATMKLSPPFSFTKGLRTMKIRAQGRALHNFETMLFDLEQDPGQLRSISNPQIETKMRQEIQRVMEENDAPSEQYQRLGLK